VLDGPINGETFTAWVEQFLIPALAPGSIVVIDNLGSHKGSRVRKLLKAAGIKLFFLPPYSPDLNPIEEMFSKLKRRLRKANERTVEATWRRIGELRDRFPPSESRNYIRGAGYASIQFRTTLGSGLIDHSQKITTAASAIADMKVWAQRS
jgi:transposase